MRGVVVIRQQCMRRITRLERMPTIPYSLVADAPALQRLNVSHFLNVTVHRWMDTRGGALHRILTNLSNATVSRVHPHHRRVL